MKPKDFFYHKTLCPAPWNNLYVGPDGTTATCSIGKATTGNLNTNSIINIVNNNPTLKEIQKAMLNGEYHSNCSVCQSLEESGTTYSLRKHYKKTISQLNNLEQYDFASGTINFSSLDLRYENTCQNACVYCGPELSSKWAKELRINIAKPKNIDKSKKFLLSKLENLQELYIAGGEPLVSKDFEIILDKLYKVNPSCKVRVNSNIRNLDTPVYKIAKKFKNLRYTISVESVGEQFEYIRYPQKWENFKQNYNIILNEAPSYNFNMVLNILNFETIFDCIDFLLKGGAHENSFIITHAHNPDWCNIMHLDDSQLTKFINNCKNYLKILNPRYNLYSSLNSCIEFITNQSNFNKNISKVKKELKVLDVRRNLDSKKIFPYIY